MPFLPEVGQAPGEPVIPVGLSHSWGVALIPCSARSPCRLGGCFYLHSTLDEMFEEKLGFLFLSDDNGPDPSPEMGIKVIQSPLAFIGAELEVAAPAPKVSVSLFEAAFQRSTPVSWGKFPDTDSHPLLGALGKANFNRAIIPFCQAEPQKMDLLRG